MSLRKEAEQCRREADSCALLGIRQRELGNREGRQGTTRALLEQGTEHHN